MKRFMFWLVLGLGTLASITANVEHMEGPVVAKILAGSAPVFMALSVDLAQLVKNRVAFGLAWTVVGLCFIVSYQSTFEVLHGWGWGQAQAAVFPFVPEGAMILAVLGLAEAHREREDNKRAEEQERVRVEGLAREKAERAEAFRQAAANRQDAIDRRHGKPSDVSETVSVPSERLDEPSANRQALESSHGEPSDDMRRTVNRQDGKRAQADREAIERMATVWPGLDFLGVPEERRVTEIRKALGVGPGRAEKLSRLYFSHIEGQHSDATP